MKENVGQPNVDFLKEILTVQRVDEVLASAVERLVGQPAYDIAATVRDDFSTVRGDPKVSLFSTGICLRLFSNRPQSSPGQHEPKCLGNGVPGHVLRTSVIKVP